MSKPPKIALTLCKSSQVESHGYDPVSRTLAVKFVNGGTYHYADVSPHQYAGVQNAKSIGGHLHSHIKDKFKHTKIGD